MSKMSKPSKSDPDVPLSKRQIANRANGRKGGLSKTQAGKDKCRYNSWKHGGRAKTVVHPYEDRNLFIARRDAFIDTLEPTDAVEATLVDLLVASTWRLERLMTVETAVLADKACKAVDLFDIEL